MISLGFPLHSHMESWRSAAATSQTPIRDARNNMCDVLGREALPGPDAHSARWPQGSRLKLLFQHVAEQPVRPGHHHHNVADREPLTRTTARFAVSRRVGPEVEKESVWNENATSLLRTYLRLVPMEVAERKNRRRPTPPPHATAAPRRAAPASQQLPAQPRSGHHITHSHPHPSPSRRQHMRPHLDARYGRISSLPCFPITMGQTAGT